MPTREFTCTAADCHFMIRSEHEDELIQMVKDHANEAHDMTMSDSDIRGAWTTA